MSNEIQFGTKELVKEIVKYSPFYLQSIIMKEFMIECEKKLFFDPEYLSKLEDYVNEMGSEEPNKFLHFLLEIGFYSKNYTKEKILHYVIEKYPNDLKFYEIDIYHIIRNIESSSDDKMKWIEIFSGEEFLYLHYHIHREIGTKDWYDRYIKNYRSLMEIKKENEELKKQLEILEDHIQFMPEGKGYEECKKNFEENCNKQ
jgi:hypothetical protein